jgi:TetR/AcrR family transcriptional regulator, transcriptional repressor of aconitase
LPRVKPDHSERRRSEILAAAERCFARLGFQKTTLQDVFREAKVSAGGVYTYFASKDELIAAVAKQRHGLDMVAIESGAGLSNAIDRVRSIARAFFAELETPQGRARRRVGVMAWSEALLDAGIRESVLSGLDGPERALAAVVAQGQAEGVFKANLDAHATARAFIALFHGLVLQILWDSDSNLEKQWAAFESYLKSLAAAPDRGR